MFVRRLVILMSYEQEDKGENLQVSCASNRFVTRAETRRTDVESLAGILIRLGGRLILASWHQSAPFFLARTRLTLLCLGNMM